MNIPTDWTFKNVDICDNFDKHVREQLPWYDLTTGIVAHIARHYIPENGRVYDIGASIGNIGKALCNTIESRNAEFIPIDNSQFMADKYAGPGKIVITDAEKFNFKSFDVAIFFLSLMFFRPSSRQDFLNKLKKKANKNGVIIIFDKCEPTSGYISTVLWRLALAGKMASGVDAKEILAKELSLGGIQRPINPKELGNCIEVFRFGDFAGWVIET